jgi:hypothetical protein
VELFRKTKILWELPPAYKVRFGTSGYPLWRFLPSVPSRIRVVVEVLHRDPKLAMAALGTRVHGGKRLQELLRCLA